MAEENQQQRALVAQGGQSSSVLGDGLREGLWNGGGCCGLDHLG
jgi:hypothetical protein